MDEQSLRKSLASNPYNHNEYIIEEFISKVSELQYYGILNINLLFLTYLLSMNKSELRNLKQDMDKKLILRWFYDFFKTEEGEETLMKMQVMKQDLVPNICMEMTQYMILLYTEVEKSEEEKPAHVDWGAIYDAEDGLDDDDIDHIDDDVEEY